MFYENCSLTVVSNAVPDVKLIKKIIERPYFHHPIINGNQNWYANKLLHDVIKNYPYTVK